MQMTVRDGDVGGGRHIADYAANAIIRTDTVGVIEAEEGILDVEILDLHLPFACIGDEAGIGGISAGKGKAGVEKSRDGMSVAVEVSGKIHQRCPWFER